ncbi:MAG: DUF4352 domain-containing protein [Thermomicrobia bacterium]|nr:DUF4352 domain-containing protein [Thermomicrobia bacterium]
MVTQCESSDHRSRPLNRRLMLLGIAGTAASALLAACGGGATLLPTTAAPAAIIPATAAPVPTVAAATDAPVGAKPTASSGQAGLSPTGAVATRAPATPVAVATTAPPTTAAPTVAASSGTTGVATSRGAGSTAAAPSTIATTPSAQAPIATTSPAAPTTPGTTATVDISQAQVHGLNQPASVPGWTMTVTKVERPGTDLIWSADNNTATATGTWVVVTVTVKKTINGTDGIAPEAFTLRSGQGFATPVPDEYWMTPDYYPTFKHSQPFDKSIPPGATVTYSIPFDVAEDATDLQFVFAQDPTPPVVFTIGNAHA